MSIGVSADFWAFFNDSLHPALTAAKWYYPRPSNSASILKGHFICWNFSLALVYVVVNTPENTDQKGKGDG